MINIYLPNKIKINFLTDHKKLNIQQYQFINYTKKDIMSKLTSSGQLIDEYCKITGEIVKDNGQIYSCTLNQTNISANQNKFYIMQLIKSNNSYVLFIRYGRTGDKGVISTKSHGTLNEGLKAFQKQFKTKTDNQWGTQTFVKKPGKYYMSEISYEDELKSIIPKKIDIPDSKLPQKVQDLIKMLSDVNMMQNALVTLNIDTKKMPLGKIKQTQLDKAGGILDKIVSTLNELEITKGDIAPLKEQLVSLSSEYYTYLPMAFGRRRPSVISSNDILSKYRDILDELRNIVVNVEITENVKSDENPIDSIYKDINTKINSLDRNSQMWVEIEKYIKNTHGSTHEAKLELLDVFEIEQNTKREKYDNHCKNIDNKTLLFHGTPLGCILSIFKNDFYLDPTKLKDPNIRIAGKMFGYGIYFADCCTKSFNYTRAQSTNNIGCFVMAEVGLGKQYQRLDADCGINQMTMKSTKCNSTKGIGKWEPSTHTLVDGIKVPNGPLHVASNNTSLRYNEHIVYDIDQIFIKYLVLVKNTGGYGGY
jgi:poly [ADP-ribose] polymerase